MAASSRRSCRRGPWLFPPARQHSCKWASDQRSQHPLGTECVGLPRDSDARVQPKSFLLRVPGERAPLASCAVSLCWAQEWSCTAEENSPSNSSEKFLYTLRTYHTVCLYTMPDQGGGTKMRIKGFTHRRVLLI